MLAQRLVTSSPTDLGQCQIAITFERVERRAMQGTLTNNQIKKVLNDVSEKVTGDTLIAPSTEAYLDEWLDAIRKRATPASAGSLYVSSQTFPEEPRRQGTKANHLHNLGCHQAPGRQYVVPATFGILNDCEDDARLGRWKEKPP